jgi:hypothetical protein
MFQLIYASTATRSFTEDDLRALAERARERNKEDDITGVLVHRNGSFLHVVEGAEDDVRALYERVCDDGRHQWVTLLKATTVEERDFPEAPLAFCDRSRAGARQFPGASPDGPSPAGERIAGGEGSAHETLIQFQRANGGMKSPAEEDAPEPGAPGSASEAVSS